MKRRGFVAAGSAGALGALAGPAFGQAKLAGDARIMCGFPPGGTADLLCRLLAEAVKSEVGQNVVVDTKTGASGFIANEQVANAPPDGRTVGLAAMAAMCVSPVMPGQKLPINVDTDLTPIASIVGVYNMLVFGKHVPFRTVPELIEQAKKNPGKISYASAGNGTSQHLAGELFKKMAGVNLLHVPYRGGAPAIQDMLAGRIDLSVLEASSLLPHVNAGKLKAYGLLSPARWKVTPDVPTLAEQGFGGYEMPFWTALFVRKGTPAEAIARLNAALVESLADPALVKRFGEMGQEIPALAEQTPQALGARHRADIEKWWPLIKGANIKAE